MLKNKVFRRRKYSIHSRRRIKCFEKQNNTWRTFKNCFTDVDGVDKPDLDMDEENAAWSKSEVAEVGDLAIIKADDLVSSLLFFITTCC